MPRSGLSPLFSTENIKMSLILLSVSNVVHTLKKDSFHATILFLVQKIL